MLGALAASSLDLDLTDEETREVFDDIITATPFPVGSLQEQARDRISKILASEQELPDHLAHIPDWNDHPGTDFAQVRDVLKRAADMEPQA